MSKKISKYELLGLIKDGKKPVKIKFCDDIYNYRIDENDYYNKKAGYLFNSDGALTNNLKDEVEILDYPLQTYAGDIFGFIPLNYIPSLVGMKIYSYQTYFTYAVIHKKRSGNLDVANNSFMTVSCFAELISNLGLLLGMALMPFICLWFARRIDKYPYPFNAFIICSFILLHLFDVMYIAIYLELTFFLCLIYKNKRKQPYMKKQFNKEVN